MEICGTQKQDSGSLTRQGRVEMLTMWRSEIRDFCARMCNQLHSIEKQIGDESRHVESPADSPAARQFEESAGSNSTDERLAVLRRQLTRWIEDGDVAHDDDGPDISGSSRRDLGPNEVAAVP
jgi:hypothetical protein